LIAKPGTGLYFEDVDKRSGLAIQNAEG